MKIVATKDALVAGVQAAGRATNKRDAALAGVLLTAGPGGLQVTGTDRDIVITAKIATRQLDGEGSVLVNGTVLAGLASVASGSEISLVSEGGELVVSSGRAVWTLRTMDPKSFPQVEHLLGGEPIDATTFLGAVRRVLLAVSHEDTRPILCGLHFDQKASDTFLTLVGTDSYRLSKLDLPFGVNINGPITVPGRALSELAKIKTSEVTIASSMNLITFSTPDVQVTSRLIEGAYPPYRQLLTDPNEEGRGFLVIEREALAEALKRVVVLASDQHHVVVLELANDGVVLRSRSTEEGTASETLEASYSGPEHSLGFNGRFLAEGLEAVGGDTVRFSVLSANKQVYLLNEDDPSFIQLLMPVAAG